MQFENDDMEELFREAAENYPLKITGADWNKVSEALKQRDAATLNHPGSRKNMLWLLLLLFIPLLCTVFNKGDRNAASETILAANNKAPGVSGENNPDQSAGGNVEPGLNRGNQNNAVSPAGTTNATNQLNRNERTNNLQHSNARYRINISGDVGANSDITTANDPVVLNGELKTEISSPELNQGNGINSNNKVNVVPAPVNTEKKITEQETKPIQTNDTKDTKTVAQKQQNKKQKTPKIYLSLLAAPDFSRVKNASVKHVGISAGVSAGYNISKHFAVELAALYSKKHYESDYKYFNNSKTNWPSNAQISGLRGTCQMIELPVTLRYNFNILHKNKFFAGAGLSSYNMKKESYDYAYSYSSGYGGTVQREAYRSYNNSSKNWLSVLQLSAGWQRGLGKKIALRVQPYYNIPLKGVGIGSLPISGAGVLAGFTVPIK